MAVSADRIAAVENHDRTSQSAATPNQIHGDEHGAENAHQNVILVPSNRENRRGDDERTREHLVAEVRVA